MIGNVYLWSHENSQGDLDGVENQIWWPVLGRESAYVAIQSCPLPKSEFKSIFDMVYLLKQSPSLFRLVKGSELELAEYLRANDSSHLWNNLGNGLNYLPQIGYKFEDKIKPLLETRWSEFVFDRPGILVVDPQFEYVTANIQAQTNLIWA